MNQHNESDERGFVAVEDLLRELSDADMHLVAPPSGVWDRIAADVSQGKASNVVELASRRRVSSRMVSFTAAAAAVAAVVIGSVVVLSSGDDDRSGTVVASAQLTYDPANFDAIGANASATALLVNDGGAFRIDLEESQLPEITGEAADLELWLIEPDADGRPAALVSLGVIDRNQPGVFQVPPEYDPGLFYVVDISVEPRDGDATHSSRSILRGPLTEA